MNITQAKEHIKNTIETYLACDDTGTPLISAARQRPMFLIGAPGIGKTDIVAQIADELGIGLVSYSMTHHTRQSALGLPFIVTRTYDNEEFSVSEYTMSEIIASVYDYRERTGKRNGILFLDEINCVSETLYPSMLQFLQFKTFGRHRVPDGWVVVCAGNPPEYNKSVHEFDIVTLDRLRKLEVEPDYDAWHAYAIDTGVHPAIITFLEAKRDCFYVVESTPSGKLFVTARGWVDLSDSIKVFEKMGKPIDKNLIVQFLQNDEIADAFAVYYELFDKYRSDYQVVQILDGTSTSDVLERAKVAAFDERLALLGLMLDALCGNINDMLETESVLFSVRDELRGVKQKILDGESPDELLNAAAARIESTVSGARDTDVQARSHERAARRTAKLLKELGRIGSGTESASGADTFQAIESAYKEQVAKLQENVSAIQRQIDHAYAFIEKAFDDERELLVFTTELTARKPTSHFIGTFGSDSYFNHNSRLLVNKHRSALVSEIEKLEIDDFKKPVEQAAPLDEAALRAYYEHAVFEFGFNSMCKMTLPGRLAGKCILDIGCRRGKGVYKLSEQAGNNGSVIGLDWSEEFIAEAEAGSENARAKSGLRRNNMSFVVGYPELLAQAGIARGSVDIVFANSVLNLAFDLPAALESIARALSYEGVFVFETVVADGPRDAAIVERARELGNSIQSAPWRQDFEAMLSQAGFADIRYIEQTPVDKRTGYKTTFDVPVAEGDEDVTFTAIVCHIRK